MCGETGVTNLSLRLPVPTADKRDEDEKEDMAQFTEWCEDLEAALAEPFPREAHKNMKAPGSPTYVPIAEYSARLNQLVGVGGWSMERPETYHAGNKFGIAIGITILGVTKWNVGDEMEDHGEPVEYKDDAGNVREKVVDYGTSSTNSYAQAFKRCCAYGFGLGLYLYDKEWTKQYIAGRVAPKNAKASETDLETIASLLGERDVDAKNHERIKARVMGRGMTADEARQTIAWLQKKKRKAVPA